MIHKDEPILDENNQPANPSTNIESSIRKMLDSQPFSILCTQGDGQPYGSLVAFAHTGDLKHFFFTTPKATRKYMLLSKCSRISLVVDTRSEHPNDMKKIEGVTITGTATELSPGENYDPGIKMLQERHPYMAEFLAADSTALFRIDVVRYFHVTRFQEVTQWTP